MADVSSSTVLDRSRVSGPSSLHVWFACVPSDDLHQITGRGGVRQVVVSGSITIMSANAEGQYLPSDVLPAFDAADPHRGLGEFAVRIRLDEPDQSKFPIGTHGVAAIYTGGGGFAVLRRITIRAHSWLNWLYPLNI